MLLAQINPQVTVEQVSANRLVVVKDGEVIRTMDCIITNDRVDEMIRWARGEEESIEEKIARLEREVLNYRSDGPNPHVGQFMRAYDELQTLYYSFPQFQEEAS